VRGLIPSIANATSGCCSHHGGVDCSRKQANGNVVCNDGWTGSSCSYSSMVKCSGYSSTENSSNSNNSDKDKSDNTLLYIIGGGIIIYVCYNIFNNKKNNITKYNNHSNTKRIYTNTNSSTRGSISHSNNQINIPQKYNIYQNAIDNNLNLIIKYISQKNEITIREIIPKEIFGENNEYYLSAFCLLRNEERVFKLSRIVEVKISNKK
jgi:hypothetical protein